MTKVVSDARQQHGAPQSWLAIAGDTWLLGAESAAVLPLRLIRLATGGKSACAEARLMVAEKLEAQISLTRALRAGEIGKGPRAITHGTVTHYLGYVRGNRKRLMQRMFGAG